MLVVRARKLHWVQFYIMRFLCSYNLFLLINILFLPFSYSRVCSYLLTWISSVVGPVSLGSRSAPPPFPWSEVKSSSFSRRALWITSLWRFLQAVKPKGKKRFEMHRLCACESHKDYFSISSLSFALRSLMTKFSLLFQKEMCRS